MLPYQEQNRADGHRQLREVHQIPAAIITLAEKTKFLHHCGNGVAFLAWNPDRAWAVSAWLHPRPEAPSRLMENSDPLVPPVFPGDPQKIVLCSDGVTALRALTEAARNSRSLPTIVTLYGERPENVLLRLPADLRDLIANAESVSGFGVVTTRAVFDRVAVMQQLYGQGQHEPGSNDQEPRYDPAEPSSSANLKGGGKK